MARIIFHQLAENTVIDNTTKRSAGRRQRTQLGRSGLLSPVVTGKKYTPYMERKAIQRIRGLRSQGMSWATIAETLDKENITPPLTGMRPARRWYRMLVRTLGKRSGID